MATANSSIQPLSLGERLSDRLNPIVVKELRQAVQSRFVVSMLLALLAIQLTAVGIHLLFTSSTPFEYSSGRGIFAVLFAIMLIVSLLFVPAYTAVRMIAERSDTNVDLLFITTIKPRSIVAGKLLTATMLAILIVSACLPFMVFTYFLRGIDLVTVFFALAFAFLIIVSSGLLALLLGSLPYGRVVKALLSILLLIACFFGFFSALGVMFWGIEQGFGAAYDTWAFWEPVLTMALIALGIFGFVVVLCIALLTPLTANRARPVRMYVTAAWALTLVIAVLWSQLSKNLTPLIPWHLLFSITLSVCFFGAVSEREESGRRVLRAVPQQPARRWLSLLFASGAANGLLWTSLLSLLTLIAAAYWWDGHRAWSSENSLSDSLKFSAGMLAYFYAYAVSGSLLRRAAFRRLPTRMTWLLGAILLLLGIAVPLTIAFFSYFEGLATGRWTDTRMLVGNPFAMGIGKHDRFYGSIAVAFVLIVSLLNLPWLLERLRAFHAGASGERQRPEPSF